MRIAFCGLTAILLSGCSWLGMGYGGTGQYGQSGGMYGADCYNGAYSGNTYGGGGYGMSYGGHSGGDAACGGAGGYSVAGGYGAGMNAGAGPNMGYGYGNGVGSGYDMSSQGYGNTTTLGSNAPYGSAFSGTSGYETSGYSSMGGSVQTVQGAPIYVPQPYPVAVGGGGYQGGGSLPFAITAGIGTSLAIGGNIFPGAEAKPSTGTRTISALTPITYKDAFEKRVDFDLGAEYDVNPTTSLLARVGYSGAEGADKQKIGTVTEGSVTEDLYASFTDLEQVRLEGGFRRYMAPPRHYGGLRPYVGATAGFTHTKDIDVIQSSDTIVSPAESQVYVDGGWSPTASGIIGAEWKTGMRTAIGLETGIRWTDKLDTNLSSDAQWSIPVQLRGRVAF